MSKLMNSAIRELIVAKIELKPFLSKEEIKFELVSNENDCFLISPECSENMRTYFSLPNSYLNATKESRDERIKEYFNNGIESLTPEELAEAKELLEINKNGVSEVCPIEGDKFIGSNRDKGSVTKVMNKFMPFCTLTFDTEEKAERFAQFIAQIGKKIYNISNDFKSFEIMIDVVANPSTGRDNVGALVLNSLLEWKAILEDNEVEYTVEEILNFDIEKLAEENPCGFEVYLKDQNGEKVYSFGECPILIEEYFWQPQHGNKFYIKEKDVSLNYNQSRDAIKVLTPTLGEVIKDTANFNSIKEDMLLLGLEIGNPSQIESFDSIYIENFNQDDIEDELA